METKYGEWEVLSDITYIKGTKCLLCKCKCGKEKYNKIYHLESGASKSCGCIRSEFLKSVGLTVKSRFYRCRRGMRDRCNNKSYRNHERYGGRGISYCKERDSFKDFYNDMIEGYDDKLTLDRIDNNKGYYKDNCKWSTPGEQVRNRSTTIFYEGKCLYDCAKEYGIKYASVLSRIYLGWSIKDALEKPKYYQLKNNTKLSYATIIIEGGAENFIY